MGERRTAQPQCANRIRTARGAEKIGTIAEVKVKRQSGGIIGSAMNLLMIIIILFAIMVSVCISFIAWRISAGEPPGRKTRESGEVKEPQDLPDS